MKTINYVTLILLIIFLNINTFAQNLWIASANWSYLYIPYDNNTLHGIKIGCSNTSIKNSILQMNIGCFFNTKDSIGRIIETGAKYGSNFSYTLAPEVQTKNNVSPVISYFSVWYGYTTNPLNRVIFSLLSGISFFSYPGKYVMDYHFNLFNVCAELKVKLTDRIFLRDALLLRSYKYLAFHNDLGISILLNSKETIQRWTSQDSVHWLHWRIGIGSSYNFLKGTYLYPYAIGRYYTYQGLSDKEVFRYQTIDADITMFVKWLMIKYLIKIYAHSYSPIFQIDGGARYFHHVFIGYSSEYKNKKLYFSMGVGSWVPDNLYYQINTDPKEVHLYDRERWFFASHVELGYKRKYWGIGFYLNRVGNLMDPNQSSAGQGLTRFYEPLFYYTSFGMNLNYKIKL